MTYFKKKEAMDITIIIDKSGSMGGNIAETITGFNAFLKEQREVEGEVAVTLIQFNHKVEVSYEGESLNSVSLLNEDTYEPSGFTALFDAIGKGIALAKERTKKTSPHSVMFVVMTDGMNNDSQEYTAEEIKELITKLEKEEEWNFIFMGSNQDAWSASQNYGFAAGKTMSYGSTEEGTLSAFTGMSKNIILTRTGEVSKSALSNGEVDFFDTDDYAAQASLGIANSQVQ